MISTQEFNVTEEKQNFCNKVQVLILYNKSKQ